MQSRATFSVVPRWVFSRIVLKLRHAPPPAPLFVLKLRHAPPPAPPSSALFFLPGFFLQHAKRQAVYAARVYSLVGADTLLINLVNKLGTESPTPKGIEYEKKFEKNTKNETHFSGVCLCALHACLMLFQTIEHIVPQQRRAKGVEERGLQATGSKTTTSTPSRTTPTSTSTACMFHPRASPTTSHATSHLAVARCSTTTLFRKIILAARFGLSLHPPP